MSKNNIIPFVKIKDFFDNITYTSMRDYVGDCKICKKKQIKIFEHPCWELIRQQSKEAWEKANANNPTPPNDDPVSPVDSEGKTES